MYLGASASLATIITFFILSNPYYKLSIASIQLPSYVLGLSFIGLDITNSLIGINHNLAYQSHWGGVFTGIATFIYKHPRFIRMIKL